MSGQFDLFNTEVTATDQEQPTATEKPSVDLKPAPAKTVDPVFTSNHDTSEIMDLIEKYGVRLWPKEKTRQNSTSRIERFDKFGNNRYLKIKDINAVHIYDWLDAEKARGLSDASLNRYASSISSVLTFAVELRLRQDSVKLRYNKEYNRERYMTEDEISALLNHFHDRGEQWMVDLVYVAANTGMRLGEILHLGVINAGRESKYGESEVNDTGIYLPPPITKTGKGRQVVCTQDVIQAALRLKTSLSENFTHRKFYDRWDDARQKIAPNDKDFVFHVLRHTYATRAANGYSMNAIMLAKHLGHMTTQTTQKYVHISSTEMQELADKMAIGSDIMRRIGN